MHIDIPPFLEELRLHKNCSTEHLTTHTMPINVLAWAFLTFNYLCSRNTDVFCHTETHEMSALETVTVLMKGGMPLRNEASKELL